MKIWPWSEFDRLRAEIAHEHEARVHDVLGREAAITKAENGWDESNRLLNIERERVAALTGESK